MRKYAIPDEATANATLAEYLICANNKLTRNVFPGPPEASKKNNLPVITLKFYNIFDNLLVWINLYKFL
jgi:hypothetical protein